MIKSVEFSDVGLKGLNSDLAPIKLPPEVITSGNNFIVDGNSIANIKPHDVWTIPPINFNGGQLQPVSANNGKFWLVLGRSAVYVYDSTAWADITSTVGYGALGVDDELLWNSVMLGSIPIINNPQHFPEYWSQQVITQVMQPLEFSPGVTWSAANKSCKIIRSHKTFLFALGLTEGGVELPNSYRWSHPADLNGLPFTWDENDTSAIASIEQIAGDSGAIVDGLSLRDGFCIYSERAITILDLSNNEFVFRARELSNTYGLVTDKCIVEVSGVHYFISGDDILRNDGNQITSIAYNRVRKRFRDQINREFFTRSYVAINGDRKEIYFCLPEGDAEYPNVAYIYNYVNDAWTFADIPLNTAHAAYGSIASASAPPLTFDILKDTHANTTLKYTSSSQASPFSFGMVSLDTADSSLNFLNPLTNNLSLDTDMVIERTDIALEGNNLATTIVAVYPYLRGSAAVSIEIGSQDVAGGPVTWQPARTYNPSTDRKISLRTTGSLHAWRVKSIGLGGVDFNGMMLEYANAGRR